MNIVISIQIHLKKKKIKMNHISIKKLGLAFGLTGALLYFGCVLVMSTVGHDKTVLFFNSLLHGIDVSSVIRMNISPVEELIGIVQTFILSWLIGACVAAIYNVSFKKSH
jgi:carbon starvation protein CstA